MNDLWNEAENILRESGTITLIGLNLNPIDTDFIRLIKKALMSGNKDLGFINYSPSSIKKERSQWIRKSKEMLDYDVPAENISLNGFETWISQMDK